MSKDLQLARTALAKGIAAFSAGDHAAAAEHLAVAARADPENVEAHHYLGGVDFHAGRFREALRRFETACRLASNSPQMYIDKAMAHSKLGENEAARQCAEKAALLDPQSVPTHDLLAAFTFPGPTYADLLRMFHSHLQPRTYVEIGVSAGVSFVLVPESVRAIGIDPEPKVTAPLGPNSSIYPMTSDEYFATRDVAGDLGGLPIDLAFIDGMHQFEFALRDFINVEKYSSARSTVLIHDCYPLTRITAERERQTLFWTGDIWRLILILRKYRPDLSVNVIGAWPTGLGIVRQLDPGSTVLAEHMQEILEEYLGMDYSVLDADKPGMLARYPNDWEEIKLLLS
jgi:Methyltransferase domain/Tetratricopeptide repeat